jgi:AraC-like DNA-binding protein
MKKIANFDKNLTFSNLFQNGNYSKYVCDILKLFKKKKIIIIANKDASLQYLPFKVQKKFDVGENCFINDYHLIKTLKKYIKNNSVKNHIFLVAAASLSNLIIYELFKEFNNNTYLDVGSTLNYYFNQKKDNRSRSYLSEYWGDKTDIEYLNRCCYW